MIRAVAFDLDGTLIQTERLKAKSYAQAAVQLKSASLSEQVVTDAFKDFVGGSREEVSKGLLARFDLEEAARKRMDEFSASAPWQVLARLRMRIYQEIISNEKTLQDAAWPHNMALLHQIQAANCTLGLATMSHCEQVERALHALKLEGVISFIATREDVENPKPDPEIYLLVAKELGVSPHELLVIEDSVSGVRAGLAAGALVLAVATPMTKTQLHQSELLDEEFIVDGPESLQEKMANLFRKFNE
ncbi:MAG: HAD family phosphatase [Brevefilum sp.]|nr:HAD family phosphatase [Brevefilum sp.]